ncbi:MAG: hypothetical protein DMG86_10430 [Acidobacteria bacterium]|jgi:hypothetical protein|nr:MAG: hypothetical protein AUI85_08590 [Acidobacteriales bacterium 13_1_40CM_3_55_5]PYX01297.1 MAG: hypothetical protein DMG86_10430 [Acidobacteriota bacterium]PYX16073.1 MAG: hypothetical protein DMG84_09020 [Acidobacteriota bacterium]
MNTRKAITFMIAFVVAFVLFFEVSAHADMSDQATQITFSQPVQIPGQVLPAGTYWFLLANISEQQDVVQIYNSDRSKLYATLETATIESQEATGHTVVKLAEQESSKPDALVAWFYPGETTGHEFLYPKDQEKQLSQDSQQTVVATPSSNNASAGQ